MNYIEKNDSTYNKRAKSRVKCIIQNLIICFIKNLLEKCSEFF